MGEPEADVPVVVEGHLGRRERRPQEVAHERLPEGVIMSGDHGVGVEGEAVLMGQPACLPEGPCPLVLTGCLLGVALSGWVMLFV